MKRGVVLKKWRSFKEIWKIPQRKRKGLDFITNYFWGNVSKRYYNFENNISEERRNTKFAVGMADGSNRKNYWELTILNKLKAAFGINGGWRNRNMHNWERTLTITSEKGLTQREIDAGTDIINYYDDKIFEKYGFIGIMRRNIMIVNPTEKEVRKNANVNERKKRNRRG